MGLLSGRHTVCKAVAVLVACASLSLASCQTTPAVPYVPPKEATLPPAEKASVESLSNLVVALGDGVSKILANESSGGMDRTVPRVAVPHFTDLGGVSHFLGRLLGLRVAGVLQRNRNVVVIDAGQIQQELRKEGIGQGFQDTRTLLDVAAALKANRLVIGNYTDLGQMLLVSVRVLTVPQGVAAGEISETIPKDASVMNLIHVGP
ncbi:MAG: hypothetical protein ACYC9S_07120 [Leptospirales bacterium]